MNASDGSSLFIHPLDQVYHGGGWVPAQLLLLDLLLMLSSHRYIPVSAHALRLLTCVLVAPAQVGLVVFNDCAGVLDEFGSYARETDDMGEPTEKIADKSTYHFMDTIRYFAVGFTQQPSQINISRYA